MIPDIPEGITDEQKLDFYSKIAGNLQDQSTIHIRWWTHRQNPSVCWICDINLLITKVLDITDKNITKSTVDIETSDMSEIEPDTEIKEDLNYDEEEPTPEYDVVSEDNIVD